MEEIMTDKDTVDKDDPCDTIDIPAHQQEFTFTYITGEDKDNGTSTNTQ
jgi:hypothetical protein